MTKKKPEKKKPTNKKQSGIQHKVSFDDLMKLAANTPKKKKK